MQQLENSIITLDRKTDINTSQNMIKYMVIFMEIIAIGLLKNEEIETDDVRVCFVCLNKKVWDLTVDNLSHEEVNEILNSKDKYEFSQFMTDKCLSLVQEIGVENALDELCGPGSYDYLKKVLNGLGISKEMVTTKLI